MPLQGLLRRNDKGDTARRRHSVIAALSEEATEKTSRASEGNLSVKGSGDQIEGSSPRPSIASREPSTLQPPSPSRSHQSGSPRPSADHPTPSISSQSTQPRFSLLRFRHASDSQLSTRARQQAAKDTATPPVPSMPPAPAIITTAPTIKTLDKPSKRRPKLKLPGRSKPSSEHVRSGGGSAVSESSRARSDGDLLGGGRAGRVTFDEPDARTGHGLGAPPPYGDSSNSALALPITRFSESSRSDGSAADSVAYATTTTTHTVSTTTTFFRLPRRKPKITPSLFPLPDRNPPSASASGSRSTPRTSTSAIVRSGRQSPDTNATQSGYAAGSSLPSPSHPAIAALSVASIAPAVPALRRDSTTSARSARSSPSRPHPMKLSRRGRSSTTETSDQHLTDGPLPTPPLPSGRTSTSTAGRNSLGGILNLSHRLRQNSEPPFPRRSLPGTPGECSSKPSSFSQSREPLVIPEREADETPAKYLARLEEAVSRGVVASILSRSNDSFSQAVLRSYMRSFAFFEDPMDMAIRKLLMEVELPKETQHIDRVLQGFADRYHECNPGIYASPDQAYFIAFSLLILHTDVFNKNNKHKMQRPEYLKNTRGEGVSDEILECLYDNISYTPFIHVEDDLDINGERIVAQKTRKTILPRAGADGVKKAPKGPVDPYSLILDRKLDVLRPTLKDVMNLDDPYGYLGTAGSLDLPNLQRSFFKSAILQIVSARSRPEAFMSPSTVANPEDAHPGLVDIKVTKVGVLWRKEVKRKKTRSAWQEWGAILTLSQLYFFRNAAWVKGLMHQYDTHHKAGQSTGPVLFKPPLENFKPDSIFSMDDAVALVDASYKKHKHAFLFVRHGGLEETYLADNERELNDWLAKLNYAAAFRTAGVRMRGLVGSNYDGQRSRGLRRMGSSDTGHSVQTPTGEVSIMSGKVDPLLAQQIRVARHQIMFQKITEAEAKLSVAQKQLDEQLRSARHLQILAPIQPKTREQLVLAAGRMAAQLKWIRMEIWRVKCHKDILNLDLEDEQKTSADVQLRNQKLGAAFVPSVPTRDSSKAALGRLESKSGMQSSPLRHAQPSIGTRAPNTSPSKVKEYGMDDIFQSPPEVTRQSSHKAQASWELPPLSFVASKSDLKGSSGTPHMLTPEHTPHASQSLANSTHSSPIPDSVLLARTPSADVRETEILKEAGLVTADGTSPRQAVDGTSDSGSLKDQSPNKPTTDGELHDRSKVRRSLHRTLREAHVPTHHRSKKGKDSSSSAGAVEDGPSLEQRSEGLARGTGSFTVHGKKASVITFGSEWQAMSPEERIQLRRQAHREGKKLLTPVMADDEATSMVSASLAEEEPVSPTSLIARRVEGDSVREEATGSEGRPSTRGTFDTESVASGKGSSEGERTPVMAVEYHGPKGVLSSGAGTSRTDDEPAAERPGTPIRDETDGNVDQDHSPRPKDTPTSPPRPRSQSATT